MDVKIGTFNLNNLFSRFNFRAQIDRLPEEEREVSVTYTFAEADSYRIRAHSGRLVNPKPTLETALVADRVRQMDLDVLAVQEVEDIETLVRFNADELGGMYRHIVLHEGNDPRLIDVGVLSKLPLGAITSWQHAVHPDEPGSRVFSRDLLEVQVLNPAGTRVLFTMFNSHFKSQYVPWNSPDPQAERLRAGRRRQRQAITTARIVAARTRPRSRYVITGDFNDVPDSEWLSPLTFESGLGVVDGLGDPSETRPPKADNPMPASRAWTHRFKPSGEPAQYELFDQILLSPALAERQTEAWIDRRQNHGGDGSDHDPAWVVVRL